MKSHFESQVFGAPNFLKIRDDCIWQTHYEQLRCRPKLMFFHFSAICSTSFLTAKLVQVLTWLFVKSTLQASYQ